MVIIKLSMNFNEGTPNSHVSEAELLEDCSSVLLHFKYVLTQLLSKQAEQSAHHKSMNKHQLEGFTLILRKYEQLGKVEHHLGKYLLRNAASYRGLWSGSGNFFNILPIPPPSIGPTPSF